MIVIVLGLIAHAIASAVTSLVSARALGRYQGWRQAEVAAFSVVAPAISVVFTLGFSIGFLTSPVPFDSEPTNSDIFLRLALIGLAAALAPATAVLFAQFFTRCWNGICAVVDRVVR